MRTAAGSASPVGHIRYAEHSIQDLLLDRGFGRGPGQGRGRGLARGISRGLDAPGGCCASHIHDKPCQTFMMLCHTHIGQAMRDGSAGTVGGALLRTAREGGRSAVLVLCVVCLIAHSVSTQGAAIHAPHHAYTWTGLTLL